MSKNDSWIIHDYRDWMESIRVQSAKGYTNDIENFLFLVMAATQFWQSVSHPKTIQI
jgi:hypothetical protein